ncbi:type IV toxin-antitoxin system AbiEi family antitoxin domain-containing protein [Mumia zhuanghuii]|uniref:Type IV toxin-antitoxin system AbiEi family antitoxin domain-containing protein n=2 Tax=Mumia TaxID=1546255 RepID=A0ABW1QS54_9ACTN|nr:MULTISPECIES: type IV toxin-antitoxin system AbiEi family antitoxin domain-containing protein [Mumia]KAA1424433.1 type IV toxin-antitoxin system AbiEi family antitoxin domain-containing protein [Mumia zhuanghuii]
MKGLERLARINGGFVTRREVLDSGLWDSDLTRAISAGEWTTVRRGVYAPTASYAPLDSRDRHLLLLRSVLAESGPDYVATHDSAVVAGGLGDYGHGTYELDLEVAHIARVGGTTSRRTSSIQYHRAAVHPDAATVIAGLRCIGAARAIVETMPTTSLDAATVLASSWLASRRSEVRRSGMVELFDEAEAKRHLHQEVAALGLRRGVRTARAAIDIADARCESVGEVRFLVLCWEYGLPRPRTQLEVPLDGDRYAEVDFAWPDVRLIIEFDGMLKYDEARAGGRPARVTVGAEKRRERAVRDRGWHVGRVTWDDLLPANRERTALYVRRELARAARLAERAR